ncbi:MAG: DUF4230 domain-containing protein [Prevotella sp.]|nr:DUF4230 domain-containing protein [Prevotella sp.]MBQ5496667.1 DUF4230 domain-containing protein [Prevotella sp.]MBQ5548164.1 DUF4230 domain-containing protein [Prevotella sp.]
MKRYLILFSWALMAACSSDPEPADTVADNTENRPTLVQQVRKCSRLYTTEYRIHKIVTHDDVLRLKGQLLRQDFDIPLPLGERKIAIPMDATIKAYIDFSNFSEQNVERDGDRITILLPDPQVVLTSSKINRDEIREYVGLTRSHFSDKELTGYEQQGREAILKSIPGLGIEETARENAARVLVPLLTDMGYDERNVTIAFRRDLDILKKLTIEKR